MTRTRCPFTAVPVFALSVLGVIAPCAPGAAQRPGQTLVVGIFPQRMSLCYTIRDGLPGNKALAIRVQGGAVLVRTDAGAAELRGDRWQPLEAPYASARPAVDANQLPTGAVVLDAARDATSRVWAVTDRGVFRSSATGYAYVSPPTSYLTAQPGVAPDAHFTCVAFDRTGNVWLGSDYGIYASDGKNYWDPWDRRTGMPCESVTCLALGPNEDVWAGTTEGVCRYTSGGQWEYYWGRRWLPDNHVNAIAAAADGSAWVATDGGVAHLCDAPMTLERKAEHFEQITSARHDRRGFVTGCILDRPGDVHGGILPEASDNDGLWTGMYVGAECFRYAATHDPAARARAHKAMWAMRDLMKYTGVPGFPARAIIYKGEKVDGYDADETVRVPGETDKIWFQSPVDPNVLCKGDTSSDELDGHYFAYLLYYDLVATDAEKAVLRDNIRALTNNILNHGLTLVGPTGRHTLWGIWAPKYLNDDPHWWDDRGLNSLEILAYLTVAYHMTGDARYAAAYRDLVDHDHYLLNTVTEKVNDPWYAANHSDDEMAFMMRYALTWLTRDVDTRRILIQGLERSYRILAPESSPLFDFTYGALTGQPCDAGACVRSLEDWPWDLVNWRVDNSRRLDIGQRRTIVEGQVKEEASRVVPYSELALMLWNGNPYDLSGGGDGHDESDATAWLLPYWMGRYFHIIAEAPR